MQPIWQTLYNAHVDLVLNGHDHNYERFAPQDPDGNADMEREYESLLLVLAEKTIIASEARLQIVKSETGKRSVSFD